MEFLNYILDKVEPIKNAADLLILILMGVCSVHSVKDSREKAAKKVAAIVAVGLIGIFVVNYVFNNVEKTEDVTASSNLTVDTVIVPNVVGMNTYEAEQVLAISGLYVKNKTEEQSTFVSKQTLTPNQEVNRGTEIELTNSLEQIEIPEWTVQDYFHKLMMDNTGALRIEEVADFIYWSKGMITVRGIDLNKEKNPDQVSTERDYIPKGKCFAQLDFSGVDISNMGMEIYYEYRDDTVDRGFPFRTENNSTMIAVPAGVYLIRAVSDEATWSKDVYIDSSAEYTIQLEKDDQ